MNGRLISLRALFGPLHRAAEPPGERDGEHLLRIDVELRAEAPAHVGRDHANARLVDSEDEREPEAQDVGHLGGRMNSHVAARSDLRENCPRFDRVGNQPRLVVGVRDDHVRLREDVIDIVGRELPDVTLVRAKRFVDERRCILERSGYPDGGGKRLVFDVDELRGVLGESARLGDDNRDTVTLKARFVDREREMLRRPHLLRHRPGAGKRALPVVPKLGAGEDRDDAVGRPRCRRVDRGDARTRIGAADNEPSRAAPRPSCCRRRCPARGAEPDPPCASSARR